MDHYGIVDANSTLYIPFTTHDTDGAAVAPSSAFEAADVRIYKNGSATQRSSEAGYTMTSPFDSVTGLHMLAIDLSDDTDAGFYAEDARYSVILVPDETVDGFAVVRVLADFSIGPPAVNSTHWGGTAVASANVLIDGAITAAKIAADAITDAKIASDVTIASVTGAVGSVTGNVGGNVAGSVGSLATQAKADVNAEMDTALADIHLDHLLAAEYDPQAKPGDAGSLLNEMVESDDASPARARFTAGALELAPTGGSAPTAAAIADAVWEEAIADHSGTAGSTAEQLAAAGSAGDPWATPLPGSYTSGQAGKIVGDNLNATVGSRATQTSVDTIDGIVDAILVDTADMQPKLGTPAGASIAADIADVEGKVDDLESRLGTPSDLGSGATVAANLVDIEAQTDDIGVAGAGLTAINLPDQTMNIVGDITGNLSGSVGSVTGNVGGNVSGSVGSLATQAKADVNAEVDTALADVGVTSTVTGRIDAAVSSRLASGTVASDVAAIKAKTDNLPEGVKINQALANFEFLMVDSADHVTGKTGLTVTAERSIDGGAFTACANSPTELSGGVYVIDLAAADLNGSVITFLFSASGADDTVITVKTSA